MKPANDGLRFLLELAVLASVGYLGYRVTDSPVRWLLMITMPLAFAAVWATWVAAKSSSALDDPWRLLLEVAIFGTGVATLAWAGRMTLTIIFGALVVVHLTLTFVFDRRTVGAGPQHRAERAGRARLRKEAL